MGIEPSFVVQVQLWVPVQCLVHWAEVLMHCWAHLWHLYCWQEAGALYPSPLVHHIVCSNVDVVVCSCITLIECNVVLDSDGAFLWPVYLIALRLWIVAYKLSKLGICIKLSSLEVLDVCCDSEFLDAWQVRFLFVLHFIWCFAINSMSGSAILKPCHMLHHLFPQKSW